MADRELRTLASDDRIRLVAEQVLLDFHDHVEGSVDDDYEREFVMEVRRTANEILNAARLEGRVEGRAEGHLEGERAALRLQLSIKFGELPSEIEAVVARASQTELERFLERILATDSLTAVFEPPITG